MNDSTSQNTPPIISASSMICWKCGEVIPAESKFCPVCQVQLFVNCPKCGHKYSSQYQNCNECGTNREEYLRRQKEREEEAERQKRMQEEARRQSEAERLKRQEAEEKAKKKAEAALRKRIREEEAATRIAQTPIEMEWAEAYYRANEKSIVDLCIKTAEKNTMISSGIYKKRMRLFIALGLGLPMLLLVVIQFWGPGPYALLSFALVLFFLPLAVINGRKAEKPVVNLFDLINGYISEAYYEQKGKRLRYFDNSSVACILRKTGYAIINNKLYKNTEPN